MRPPVGLQKAVLEIPLVSGLSQDIASEVSPVGALYDLTNVEIDKVGNVARRHGFTGLTSAVYEIGTSSSSLGIPRKISSRKDELYIITGDDVYLGSGGGGSGSGDVIWVYSPGLNAWKPEAKVPRPTLERWSGVSNSGTAPDHADVSYVQGSTGSFVVLSYVVRDGNAGNAAGLHVIVYDAVSRSVVIADTLVDTGVTRVESVTCGDHVCIIYYTSITLKATYFNASAPTNGLLAPVTLFASPNGDLYFTTGTDGTNFYLLHQTASGSGSLALYWMTNQFAAIGSSTVATDMGVGYRGLYYGGGRVHFAYVAFVGGTNYIVRYGSTGQSTGFLVGPVDVSPPISIPWAQALVAASGSDDAIVVYEEDVVASVGPVTGTATPKFYWRKLSSTSTVPVVSSIQHVTANISATGHPFVFDSRTFIPVVGMDRENQFRNSGNSQFPYSGYGHALVEIGTHDIAAGAAYQTPFPVAVWARDNSSQNGFSAPGTYGSPIKTKGGFGGDSDRYVATLRATRLVDKFGQGGQDSSGSGNTTASVDTGIAYGIDIIRLAFDDKKRWECTEIGGISVLACGLPYAYDGQQAHECGHVWRPEILGYLELAASGSFNTNDTVSYKAVYEWEDVNGDTWYSDSSYPADITVAGSGVAITVCIRIPTITAKPLGGQNFSGRLRIGLYRALSKAPNDYQKINQAFVNTFSVSNITFSDTGTDSFGGASRAYIVGGELENSCAPALYSICQHGARLFGLSDDDNSLYYTKERRRQRGIEWSQYQRLKLPQKRGMAVRGIQDAILVFCEKSIYILEGDGPDALGNPNDGYSKLRLICDDQGCSERNAAWRIPKGVIFRGYQGLWIVNSSLGIENIGDSVKDFVDQVSRFVDGALDTKKARLRLMCLMLDGSYKILNFWYDTERWSIDTLRTGEGTQFSTTVFQGIYYRALQQGVYKYDDTVWRDAADPNIYLASVQTGWLRLGSMHNFKRVWRGLATVGRIQGENYPPYLDVKITVENEEGICAQQTFPGNVFATDTDWSIRAHLFRQKGKAFRVKVEEIVNSDTNSTNGELGYFFNPRGYTFSCLGLEYGVKRGAAKLAAERSK